MLSLATGALLYSYQTHNYIASSPAVVDHNVLFTSADGFLYDFALGGGNTGSPTTAVTSATDGATVPYESTLTVSGTASDPSGVKGVQLSVQEDGLDGQWWSTTGQKWEQGPIADQATLSSPGATTTTWTLSVPVPTRGTILTVWAAAVDKHNIADASSDQIQAGSSRVTFTVSPSPTSPTLAASASRVAPGGGITVNGMGYKAGEKVQLSLATSPPHKLTTVAATSSGTLPSTVVTIPTWVNFGAIALDAEGLTSGDTATPPDDLEQLGRVREQRATHQRRSV